MRLNVDLGGRGLGRAFISLVLFSRILLTLCSFALIIATYQGAYRPFSGGSSFLAAFTLALALALAFAFAFAFALGIGWG